MSRFTGFKKFLRKGRIQKGQWYIIAAVLFSYSLLTFFSIFNSYSQIDYTSIVRRDEDLLYYNIFTGLEHITQTTYSENRQGDLSDYAQMVRGNLLGKGVLFNYELKSIGGLINIKNFEMYGKDIRLGEISQSNSGSDECTVLGSYCEGDTKWTCGDFGSGYFELISDTCSGDCSCQCGGYGVTEAGHCDDGIDNDCDGRTDYADSSECSYTELCNVPGDEDNDGKSDCYDEECAGKNDSSGWVCCPGGVSQCVQDDCIVENCNSSKQCEYVNRLKCAYDECTGQGRCESAGGNCADPDLSPTVCTDCYSGTWDPIQMKCCGDDPTDNWCNTGNGSCVNGVWTSFHCNDLVQNCDETGLNCGGSYCGHCGLPGYAYKMPVYISNLGTSGLTNYQVRLEVPRASAMQADFDDVRFTLSDGFTLVDYWRESASMGSSGTLYLAYDDGVRCYLNDQMVVNVLSEAHGPGWWNKQVDVSSALQSGENTLACWVANGGENTGTVQGGLDLKLVVDGRTVIAQSDDDSSASTKDSSCSSNPSFKYYTCSHPCEPTNWYKKAYDDSAWNTGYGPFAPTSTWGCANALTSAPDDVFIRKKFTLGAVFWVEVPSIPSSGSSTSTKCCSASEGGTCTATCPAGTTVSQVKYIKYGASACSNLGACDSSAGASCAGQPNCIGQSSCTWTFNNANCGDTCYGYVKTGYLTVVCSSPATTNTTIYMYYGNATVSTTSNFAGTFDSLPDWKTIWTRTQNSACSGPSGWTNVGYDDSPWTAITDVSADFWNQCEDCDMYIRTKIMLPSVSASTISVLSDDGQWVYAGDGTYIRNCGCGSCHCPGTCSSSATITSGLRVGENAIAIWCTEHQVAETCSVTAWNVPNARVRKYASPEPTYAYGPAEYLG
ncbi:MAG: hypothetical protein JW727_06115 [Candidatus Aenigmarchaeota archaeon]|nr:hypothetical protein [Candidatus Aenigmarchaeota archaeon]